jgi:ABC-type multidrug transport system ATPase subunit
MTVLLSSHLLAEVEELCNRVAIVRDGLMAYEGTLAELRARPGSATGCGRPTTTARWRCAARTRASPTSPLAAPADPVPHGGRERSAELSRRARTRRARARALAEPRHARGPVLRAHRG